MIKYQNSWKLPTDNRVVPRRKTNITKLIVAFRTFPNVPKIALQAEAHKSVISYPQTQLQLGGISLSRCFCTVNMMICFLVNYVKAKLHINE
jgi:hypothetical protein